MVEVWGPSPIVCLPAEHVVDRPVLWKAVGRSVATRKAAGSFQHQRTQAGGVGSIKARQQTRTLVCNTVPLLSCWWAGSCCE